MMSARSVFITVIAAHALAVASPGPDFAVVLRNTITAGRRGGVWTAAGIGSGILAHVAYGLFGLGWAVREMPGLLDALGWGGAALLAWLGWRALRAAAPMTSEENAATDLRTVRGHYLAGLFTNLLNPKAALFFVALFSAVLAAHMTVGLRLALALWLPLASFAWFALLATALSTPTLATRLQRYARPLTRGMGVILLLLALLTAVHQALDLMQA